MKKIIFPLFFCLLVGIPAILPFFHKGYFPTHDGEWAVVRLGDMFRTIRDFQIPPRYSGALNFGYGYPLFNFVYPMPYYLGTLIHFLGFGFVDTIKIIFAASVPLSAFFMFLSSRLLWKNIWAGVVSAILYVYFPYRMVDLYVRGSIGESLSFVLFPLLFYFALKLIEKNSYIWILATAISLAGLITTHNIMTVLFLPVWSLFIISKAFFDNKKNSIKTIAIAIGLGVGLSAFFWVPAILEKNLILLSQIPIADRNLYFVNLSQLLLPKWGYGVPTDPNGFTYQIGLSHLAVLFIIIFVLFRNYFKSVILRQQTEESHEILRFAQDDKASKMSFLLLSIILFFVFLMTKPSSFLWENLPLLSEINYPWTVLGILGFLVSLLVGFLCGRKITQYIAVALSLTAIFLVLPYAKPQYYLDRGDNYYLTNDATTTSSNELMPLWVKKMPNERPKEKVEVFGQGKIKNTSYNSKKIVFDADAKDNLKVRINTIYYPGWKAYVFPSCHPERSEGSQVNNDCKGKAVVIDYSNEKGVMELQMPKGENKVELKFSETPLRLFADFLSVISIILLLFYGIILRRSK